MFLARLLLSFALAASLARFTFRPHAGPRMDDNGITTPGSDAAGSDAGWTIDPNG